MTRLPSPLRIREVGDERIDGMVVQPERAEARASFLLRHGLEDSERLADRARA